MCSIDVDNHRCINSLIDNFECINDLPDDEGIISPHYTKNMLGNNAYCSYQCNFVAKVALALNEKGVLGHRKQWQPTMGEVWLFLPRWITWSCSNSRMYISVQMCHISHYSMCAYSVYQRTGYTVMYSIGESYNYRILLSHVLVSGIALQ